MKNKFIQATDKYFNPEHLRYFFERELKAKIYNKPFSVVEKFYISQSGEGRELFTSIPQELQIFDSPIVYIYVFDLPKTLEWHRDEMRLDYACDAKYVALIEGSGVLELKIDDHFESYDFGPQNALNWVEFPNTELHRFIVKEKAKMIMAITLNEKEAYEKFDRSYFWSTEVDAINKIVWNQQKENPGHNL